jgi:hypothetical protein
LIRHRHRHRHSRRHTHSHTHRDTHTLTEIFVRSVPAFPLHCSALAWFRLRHHGEASCHRAHGDSVDDTLPHSHTHTHPHTHTHIHTQRSSHGMCPAFRLPRCALAGSMLRLVGEASCLMAHDDASLVGGACVSKNIHNIIRHGLLT